MWEHSRRAQLSHVRAQNRLLPWSAGRQDLQDSSYWAGTRGSADVHAGHGNLVL